MIIGDGTFLSGLSEVRILEGPHEGRAVWTATEFLEDPGAARERVPSQQSQRRNVERRGFIDKTGRFVIEPRFEEVSVFSEGLAFAGVRSGNSLLYGYVDKTGHWVIKPQFNFAHAFSWGLAAVRVGR